MQRQTNADEPTCATGAVAGKRQVARVAQDSSQGDRVLAKALKHLCFSWFFSLSFVTLLNLNQSKEGDDFPQKVFY